MKKYIVNNSRKLDIEAQSALSGLFRGKMVGASILDNKTVMRAQLGIKNLEYAIGDFIESKSYSSFKIYQENDSVMIRVRNFKILPDNTTEHKYKIIVDPTWQNATIYQASVGGTMTRQGRVINDD